MMPMATPSAKLPASTCSSRPRWPASGRAPWMLPPTRTTAPTSDSADPTAAMHRRDDPDPGLAQRQRRTCSRLAPNARAWSSRPGGSRATAAAVSATIDRERQAGLREVDAVQGEEQLEPAERRRGEHQQRQHEPDDHRRQPEPGVGEHHQRRRGRGTGRARGPARSAGRSTSAITVETARHLEGDPDEVPSGRGRGDDQVPGLRQRRPEEHAHGGELVDGVGVGRGSARRRSAGRRRAGRPCRPADRARPSARPRAGRC